MRVRDLPPLPFVWGGGALGGTAELRLLSGPVKVLALHNSIIPSAASVPFLLAEVRGSSFSLSLLSSTAPLCLHFVIF